MVKSEKFNLAFSYHNSGNLTKAKELYDEILQVEPENDEVWDLLGLLFFQINDLDNAQNCFNKAINLNPRIYYLENLARLYLKKEDFELAKNSYEKLILIDSKNFENYFNLGMTYKNLNNLDKSLLNYQKALELKPESYEVYFNLASVYLLLKNYQKAIDCYKKTIELNPQDWEAEYFLSLIYMQTKDYKNGLKCFETRLCRQSAVYSQIKTYPKLMEEKPLWQGQNISAKTLYTYYEAGFGDMIMWYRFVPELVKKCKKLIIKPQKELVELFRKNSYGAEIMDLYKPEKEMDFDYHIPFLSIPYVLNKTDENIFINHDKPYLKADPDLVNYFHKKYFDNNKIKIGIKWQGNTFYEKNRVLNVEDFFPLFEIPNTQFYSCQTFEGSQEFEKISEKYNVINLAPEFKDFSYTAGAVENMDLIICNDTSLAHLAGAMRKKCFVILPYSYNWRWHTDISKCDWYDSVKLFKQTSPKTWKDVFEQILNDLKSDI